MPLIADFKKFAFKGNAVDLAVGVVIGAAFGKIVAALVGDLIMPIVALVLPSGDWRQAGIVLKHGKTAAEDVAIKYGDLLGTIIDFVVVAFVLFLVVSKVIRALERKPAAAPTTKKCPECLEEIALEARRCKHCTAALARTAAAAE